MNWSFYP